MTDIQKLESQVRELEVAILLCQDADLISKYESRIIDLRRQINNLTTVKI